MTLSYYLINTSGYQRVMICKPYATLELANWDTLEANEFVKLQVNKSKVINAISSFRILLGDCTVIAQSIASRNEINDDWKTITDFINSLHKSKTQDVMLVLQEFKNYFTKNSLGNKAKVIQNIRIIQDYEENTRNLSLQQQNKCNQELQLSLEKFNDKKPERNSTLPSPKIKPLESQSEYDLHSILTVVQDTDAISKLNTLFSLFPPEALLNLTGGHLQTPLHLATIANRIENVQYLLDKG